MFSPMARTMSRPVARSLVKSDPPGELQGPLRTRLRVYLYGNGGLGVAGGSPPPPPGVVWRWHQLFGMLFLELHEISSSPWSTDVSRSWLMAWYRSFDAAVRSTHRQGYPFLRQGR